MSGTHTGNVQPQLDLEEHNGVANAKRVVPTMLDTGGSTFVGPSALALAGANAQAVAIVDAAGAQITSFGGGTQYTEDAASVADPIGTQLIARRRDALVAETSTDGDVIALNSTNKGEVYVKQTDAVPVTDNGGSLTIDGSLNTVTTVTTVGTVTNLTTVATVANLSRFNGNVIDTSSGNLSAGTLRVVLATDQPANTNALKVDASATTQPVSGTITASNATGNVAHDGVDSGNPVKVGGKAVSALSTATMVTSADRSDLVTDVDGAVITRPHCPLGDILVERVTDTGGTSTALSTFGATASTKNHITTIVVFNDSTTNGFVDIRDGTAGSVIMTLPAPAKGGSVTNFVVPLRQPTANTALAYDVSGALTTVYLSFIGFKSKV